MGAKPESGGCQTRVWQLPNAFLVAKVYGIMILHGCVLDVCVPACASMFSSYPYAMVQPAAGRAKARWPKPKPKLFLWLQQKPKPNTEGEAEAEAERRTTTTTTKTKPKPKPTPGRRAEAEASAEATPEAAIPQYEEGDLTTMHRGGP